MGQLRVFVEDCRYPDRVTHATGYAEVQRQIVMGLAALGLPVGFPECEASLRAATLIPKEYCERLLAVARQAWRDDRDTLHLQVASPDGFQVRPERCTVGLTMVEREVLSGPAADWVERCNALDAIVVPSEWNRVVFERLGVRNLHVVPLGVDVAYFVPPPVKFIAVFAGLGWPGSRCNWEDLIACFEGEFAGQSDVELTIVSLEARGSLEYGNLGHALRQAPKDVARWLQRLRASALPPVRVLAGGGHSQERIRSLYQEQDCFVSYSREGWGLPLLEAMACSLDVIACDYGAPMTFLEGSPARLFAAGRLRPDNLRFEGGDLAGLRDHMRAVYRSRRQMRLWAERFGWPAAVARLAELLGRVHATWLKQAQPQRMR